MYSAPAGAPGDDPIQFTFRVNDGTSDSAVYTLTVDVESRSTVPGDIEVNFGAPAYTATEGGTAATVEVVLSQAPTAEVHIPLSVLSRNWGATAGDHSPIPATVAFATTDTRRTFTVTATDDDLNDDGESVTLRFGTLPAGYAAGRTDTATVSLADNDGVLVSNTRKTPAARSSANLGDSNHGVKFTTGPHLSGYVLDSIEVTLTNTGNSAVSRSNLNSGVFVYVLDTVLDSTVALLSASTSLGASTTTTVRFTVPAGTTLLPSRLYRLIAITEGPGDLDDVYWRHTASTAEDAARAPGWSIDDEAEVDPLSGAAETIPPLMFRANGRPATAHTPADIEVSFGAAGVQRRRGRDRGDGRGRPGPARPGPRWSFR